VPRSSVLWRPAVCATIGALAGVLIILGFNIVGWFDSSELWIFCATAAVVGGVTCLTGCITRDRFKPAI
jgi:hypothetical protein